MLKARGPFFLSSSDAEDTDSAFGLLFIERLKSGIVLLRPGFNHFLCRLRKVLYEMTWRAILIRRTTPPRTNPYLESRRSEKVLGPLYSVE